VDAVRVITWNLFHCRDAGADPAAGRGHVPRKVTAEMAALLRRAAPDVLLLQEVPPGALRALGRDAGMRAGWSVLTAPRVGPVALRAWLGARRPDLWRTHEGNANAILLGRRLRPVPGSGRAVRLNPLRDVAHAARRRRLEPGEAARWALEARAAVVGRAVLPGGAEVTLASVHLHNARYPWQAVQEAEVLAGALAGAAGPLVVGGDVNVPPGHPALAPLLALGLGDPSGDDRMGIDRILVRGLPLVAPARRWRPEERTVRAGDAGEGRALLLSDHDPVEAAVGVP